MDSIKYIGKPADRNSGVYTLSEINEKIQDQTYPTNYEIENSCRFDGISSSLSFSPTSDSSYSGKGTFSSWLKVTANSGTNGGTFISAADNNHYGQFYNEGYYFGNAVAYIGGTTPKIRDYSAWYHVLFVFDTTLQTNRLKIYVNNILQTGGQFNTEPSQNSNFIFLNTTQSYNIGSRPSSNYFNGYIADVHFVDGQALDPTHFAHEHPTTGRWSPKRYKGTYGNNGFHLEFKNNGTHTGVGGIGEDTSGNGNHWTTNNLDHSDVVQDSPTNNFSILNQLNNISHSYSEGNLSCISTVNNALAYANMPIPQIGKWYCEFLYFQTGGAYSHIGVQPDLYNGGYGERFRIIARSDGSGWINGSSGGTGSFSLASWTTGDIISMMCDADTGTLTYYKNGVFSATVSFSDWNNIDNKNRSFFCLASLNVTHKINFGQDPTFSGAKVPSKVYTDSNNQGRFFYQPPGGALALNEANLNQPEITPNQYPIDETNQHRLTYNGNVTQSKFTPYATDGYSINLNGSNQRLSLSKQAFEYSTGDFSFECFVYVKPGDGANYQVLLDTRSGAAAEPLVIGVTTNNTFYYYTGSEVASNGRVSPYTWTHLLMARQSGTLKMFLNGQQVYTASSTANFNPIAVSTAYIGSAIHSIGWMKGYITDIRSVVGSSAYDISGNTIVVPTSPIGLTEDGNTRLLISSNSKQFVDSSSNNYPITLTGSPEILDWSPYTPELVRKGVHFRRPEDYGGGSFYLSGSGQQILFPTNTDFDFGSGEFSVEMWVYLKSAITGITPLFGYGNDAGTDYTSFHFAADGKLQFYQSGSVSFIETTASVLVGQWNHLVFSRSGNTINVYSNGQKVITNNFTVATRSGHNLRIGSWYNTTNYGSNGNLNGYITDYKIVKGTTVYSEDGNGNITPPTGPLTSDANTDLLLQPWHTKPARSSVYQILDSYKNDETGKALTYVGNANVVNTSPYKDGVTGSFSVTGNDKLKLDDSDDWDLGSSFTTECWFYGKGSTSTNLQYLMSKWDSAKQYNWYFTSTSAPFGQLKFEYDNGSNSFTDGGTFTTGMVANRWYHLAFVNNGGTTKLYINGIAVSGTGTIGNVNLTTDELRIFSNLDPNKGCNALIADFRIVKGQALYTTDFTPPAYPLRSTHYTTNGQDPSDSNSTRTPITGTVSLLVQPGTGFTKNSAAQNPKKYLNTLLYSGTGQTQSITGLDFQSDLIWFKNRSSNYHHGLFDSVRGVDKVLKSSATSAEATYTEQLKSFESNGFTVGDNSDSGNYVNVSGNNYVAWCWKAGGAPSADGVAMVDGTATTCSALTTSAGASKTPTRMSVNTKAGFSIVKYSGNGSIPHGLSSPLDLIIVKNLDLNGEGWTTWHSSFSSGDYVYLHSTQQKYNSTSKFSGVPTNTVFQVGADDSTGSSSYNYISYCWHSVAGYSAFGSYEGNQNADGPFIYTGFRPAFVLTKPIDFVENWVINDSARSPNNPVDLFLRPDESAQESSSAATMDFLSNGFKLRTSDTKTNVSSTIIYMAFAEQPFTKTTAR